MRLSDLFGYWEAKLAVGHIPSEAKIENFIRTKYESKRWVMDGPMPDPATLDGEEPTPAASSAQVERTSSQRQAAPTKQSNSIDLFGDDVSPPARPSTGPPLSTQPPSKAQPAPPKQTKPAESLLGLDFFGAPPAAPARPSSDLGAASGATSGPSKSDLKQSILSLYASAPKPAPQPAQPAGGFGALQSARPQQSGFGGLNDAFSTLNVAPSAPAQQDTSFSSPFASLAGGFGAPKSAAASKTTQPSLGGGSFFDPAPKSPPAPKATTTAKPGGFGGFGDVFSSSPAAQPAPSASADLFDFSAPAAAAPPAAMNITQTHSTLSPTTSSPFNLSSAASKPAPKPAATSSFSPLGASDPWGSGDVWTSAEPAAAPSAPAKSPAVARSTGGGLMDDGWGAPVSAPTVRGGGTRPVETTIAADEDFGGWGSALPAPAAAPAATTTATTKPAGSGGGFGGSDDLFSNVWE
jgi:stromal membrane-associated protein